MLHMLPLLVSYISSAAPVLKLKKLKESWLIISGVCVCSGMWRGIFFPLLMCSQCESAQPIETLSRLHSGLVRPQSPLCSIVTGCCQGVTDKNSFEHFACQEKPLQLAALLETETSEVSLPAAENTNAAHLPRPALPNSIAVVLLGLFPNH